jgi:hypothetical protein
MQKCHERIWVVILLKTPKCYAKNGKLMIPTSLRHRAISWYHHYLQHPGHLCLEETMRSVMYWKGMTGSHPSWSSLLHLRFYSGNNLCVRRNVPMFYMDLWPACAHPKTPLHLCYQKNSNCPTATRCALDLVEFKQGGENFHSFFPQPCAK